MAFQLDRANRLDSMAIDDRTRAVLREVIPLALPHFDGIVKAAYDQIMKYPAAAKAYQGVAFEDVVRGQRKHWLEELLPATFTEEQMNGIVALFQHRQKMGLNLRWFFVFYTTFMRTLITKVAPAYRKKPERLVEVLDALSTVLLFDLELASAAYMQGSEDDAAAFIRHSADDLQARVALLAGTVGASTEELRGASHTMAAFADQTAGQADAASKAAEVSEHNIQTAAAATEELAASIQEISRQVGQSADIAANAVSEAERTDTMIKGLAEAAAKIGTVVKLINDIASQTNLLALNATMSCSIKQRQFA